MQYLHVVHFERIKKFCRDPFLYCEFFGARQMVHT